MGPPRAIILSGSTPPLTIQRRGIFRNLALGEGASSPLHLSHLTCTSGSPSCISLSSLLYIWVLLKGVSLGSHFEFLLFPPTKERKNLTAHLFGIWGGGREMRQLTSAALHEFQGRGGGTWEKPEPSAIPSSCAPHGPCQLPLWPFSSLKQTNNQEANLKPCAETVNSAAGWAPALMGPSPGLSAPARPASNVFLICTELAALPR